MSGTPPNVTYTPALDYVGPDSFTFKVNDGALDSADAVVSIQVIAPPDPPEIVAAVGACDGRTINVTFNEPVEPASATDLFNYLVIDVFGNPSAIVIAASLSADQQTVTLVLDMPLNPSLSHRLEVVSVCDLVGDCLQRQIVPIEFDSEPPVLACDVAVENLWPPNYELVDVGLSAVTSGASIELQVFSNEPDSGLGDAQFDNGILTVRAQREGKLNGRVYLIVVTSTDECGNVAVCCTTVAAPHDSSQAAFDSVSAEAAAAQAQCSPNGSPVTPYRLLP